MASKPMHECWYFWVFSLSPIAIALLCGIAILLAEPQLNACFSSLCFSNFVKIFKIPLTISALSIPAAGIIAAIHRSSETQIQISLARKSMDITNENNTFSNYIKHRDDFEKTLKKIEGYGSKNAFTFANPEKLYKKLFPKNSYTHLETSLSSAEGAAFLDSLMNSYEECSKVVTRANPTDEEIFRCYKAIDVCFGLLTIVVNDKHGAYFESNTGHFNIVAFDSIHLQNITVVIMTINRLLMFCTVNKSIGVDLREANHSRFEEFNKKHAILDEVQ